MLALENKIGIFLHQKRTFNKIYKFGLLGIKKIFVFVGLNLLFSKYIV